MRGDFVVQGMSHEMATQLTFEYRLQLRQGTMCCPEGPNLLQRVTIGSLPQKEYLNMIMQ